jgi:methionine-rich copper-binding protein CopC
MMGPHHPEPTRTPRIWVALLVAAVFTVTGAPQPAWAHTALISSSPADGTVVAKPPATVVLNFNEPAIATGTKVLVTGPDGSATEGEPELVDNTVRQDLKPDLPAGRYAVEWRVTSADGHPITGTFSFRVRTSSSGEKSTTGTPAATTATPAATSPATSTTPAATPPATSATPAATSPAPAATPSTAAQTRPGASSGWLWLLAILPIGLAAVLGWRFSRHR